MKLKIYQKNILFLLIIEVGGFILFNLAFLLAALTLKAVTSVWGMTEYEGSPVVGRMIYLLILFFISWFVFHSRLNEVIKATYFSMPLMIILVMVGISFYHQSKWLIAGIGTVIIWRPLKK